MQMLYAIWSLLKDAGDIATIGVLVVLWFIWKNDLKHMAKDVCELKMWFRDHIKWHMDQTGDEKK